MLLHPDIIEHHLCDYMNNAGCYRLTRAFPLLMLNKILHQKTEQYKMEAPCQCIKCRKRVSSLARLRLHNMLLHPDIIEHHLCDYMDNATCYRLTRAFPLLMLNKTLHQKTEQYKVETPYRCIRCRKRVSSLTQLRLHNATTHPESIEEQMKRFFSLN